MSYPWNFPTFPAGNFPAQDWLDNWNTVGRTSNIVCSVTGTANAIILTPVSATPLTPSTFTLQTGMMFWFVAALSNTGATSVTVVGSGATLSVFDGTGTAVTGGIDGGTVYALWYDPTLNSGTGGYRLISPGASSSAGTNAHSANVEFINDGTATGFLLIPYNGNTMLVWCATTSSWKTLTIPAAGIAGNVTNITIDGVAGQSIASDVVYSAGVQFADASCTTGVIVLSSTGYAPSTTKGVNVLNGYTNTPLVGTLVKHAGTIQGSINGELLISWYNRGRVDLTNSALGNTGGLLNTWVKLAGTLDFLIWADSMPVVDATIGVAGTAALNRIDFGLSYQNSATAPDYFQCVYDVAGNVGMTIPCRLPFPATNPGFYRVTGWLRTQAGTATTGVVTNATITASVNF